jgi:hypothetical protein
MVTPEDKKRSASAKAPHTPDNEAFLRWLQTVPDPVERYALATSELEKHQATVRRLSSLRAEALADASESESLSSVARRLGVSRQRAHQLVNETKRTGGSRAKGKKQTSRDGATTKPQKGQGKID